MMLLGIVTQAVRLVVRKGLAAIDRWTEPPIMRQRINAGSDEYFDWHKHHEGDSELDELFDLANERGDDED